jgi:diguanylate cyclase (GGDEF)-like protein
MAAGTLDSWSGELEHVVSGRPTYLQVSLSGMHSTQAGDRQLTVQIVDVTSRRAVEAKLIQLTTHDPLTGLPNRAALIDQLAAELRTVGPAVRFVGVLFLDLDDFKTINDAVGHTVGDDVLQAVAERLLSLVRPGDVVARLGGDEFVLLCPNLHEEKAAQRVAERVLASFNQPFLMEGKSYRVDASVGIAVAGPDADPNAVLRQADSAMHAAKAKGKGRAEVFDPEMEVQAARQAQLVPRLYEALHNGEFRLHFQPVVDLGSSRPVGVEALIRWQHPDRGLLPPADFLDVAEQSDLVIELGRWVLEEACRWSAMWQETLADAAPVVHVNVSARHMTHPSFVRDVKRALRDSGCSPHRLVLELTETHLLTVGAPVRRHLAALRELGIRLAADDYGTGYSPLSHVTELDVDILKIDKSFVFSLLSDHKAHAVARAIIGLGNSLGLEVVAEGVETPAIAAELVNLGCISGQGYLWSAARPADTIEDLLRGQRPLAGEQPALAPPKQRSAPAADSATRST